MLQNNPLSDFLVFEELNFLLAPAIKFSLFWFHQREKGAETLIIKKILFNLVVKRKKSISFIDNEVPAP